MPGWFIVTGCPVLPLPLLPCGCPAIAAELAPTAAVAASAMSVLRNIVFLLVVARRHDFRGIITPKGAKKCRRKHQISESAGFLPQQRERMFIVGGRCGQVMPVCCRMPAANDLPN